MKIIQSIKDAVIKSLGGVTASEFQELKGRKLAGLFQISSMISITDGESKTESALVELRDQEDGSIIAKRLT
jgi:hypothetical protein